MHKVCSSQIIELSQVSQLSQLSQFVIPENFTAKLFQLMHCFIARLCDIPMCEADRMIGLGGVLRTAGMVFVSSINLQYMIQLCQLVIVNQLSCFSCFSWIQYSPIYSHNILSEFKFRYEDIMSSAWM